MMPTLLLAMILGSVVLLLPVAAWRARSRDTAEYHASAADLTIERSLARAAESGRTVHVSAAGALAAAPAVTLRAAEVLAAAQIAQRLAEMAARHTVPLRASAGDAVGAELMARASAEPDTTATLLAHGDDLTYAAALHVDAGQQPMAAFVMVGSVGATYPLIAAAARDVPQIGAASDAVTLAQFQLAGADMLSAEQMYLFDPGRTAIRAGNARRLMHDMLRLGLISALLIGTLVSIAARAGWWNAPWLGV